VPGETLRPDHALIIIRLSVALTDSAQLSERRCQGHNLRYSRTEAWAAADDGEGWGVDTTVRCRVPTSRSSDDDNDVC